jgi:hypothetical protein
LFSIIVSFSYGFSFFILLRLKYGLFHVSSWNLCIADL